MSSVTFAFLINSSKDRFNASTVPLGSRPASAIVFSMCFVHCVVIALFPAEIPSLLAIVSMIGGNARVFVKSPGPCQCELVHCNIVCLIYSDHSCLLTNMSCVRIVLAPGSQVVLKTHAVLREIPDIEPFLSKEVLQGFRNKSLEY